MISPMPSPNSPTVLAIVQAGGKGSRMGVLTQERAKPALPFAGTHQLIDIALSNLVNSGIDDVWVSVQYQASTLDQHLQHGRPWDLDRSIGGFRRLVPQETEQWLTGGFSTGNADDLYRIRHQIRDAAPDVVVVLSADQVFTLDLREVIGQHLKREADATIATTEVPITDASAKAVVTIDAAGRIGSITEKPENPQRGTISAEVFIYRTEALLDALDAATEAQESSSQDGDTGLGDFAQHLIPTLIKRDKVFAYPLTSYWRDMGRPETYLAAHRDLARGEVRIFDDPQWPMRTLGSDSGPARVRESAVIEDSMISPGCDVAGTVRRSTLGPGVIVREGAVVEDSVIFDTCVIEKDATVKTAIVDAHAAVRAGATVGERPAATKVRDADIAVLGRASVIRGMVKPGEQIEPGQVVERES